MGHTPSVHLQTPLEEMGAPPGSCDGRVVPWDFLSLPRGFNAAGICVSMPGWLWWRWKQEEEFPLRRSSAFFVLIFSPALPQALLLLCY